MQYYCVTGSADGGVRVWVLIIEASIGMYCVTSLSYSVDLKGSMDRWDLHIGQKRPLPEENVVLGDSVTSIGAGAKEGHRRWDKCWERGRWRRKERTDR